MNVDTALAQGQSTNDSGRDEKADVAVEIEVNRRPVTLRQRKAIGSEIKQAAMAQEVNIQADFALFEVHGQGNLKPVADDETVTLHKGQKFRAIAPDDNS